MLDKITAGTESPFLIYTNFNGLPDFLGIPTVSGATATYAAGADGTLAVVIFRIPGMVITFY